MNSIEQILGPQQTGTTGVGQKAEELGQEDFLKLLVAQLKNQDPNNPADNGEFLGQIAQFSMVSGIDDLGVSFDSVAGSLYSTQALQASTLVGKQVLVETNEASLTEGEPVEGILGLYSASDSVQVQIMDAAGSLVKRIDMGNLPAGGQKFSWNGLGKDDEQMPDGEYTIKAEALVNGELEAIPLQVYSDVESVSVDRSNTAVLLHLANQENVGLSQVREYR